mgnify:CR=1 FL=1
MAHRGHPLLGVDRSRVKGDKNIGFGSNTGFWLMMLEFFFGKKLKREETDHAVS